NIVEHQCTVAIGKQCAAIEKQSTGMQRKLIYDFHKPAI
ncbi:hypothetical protein A2U01_0019373, partial [Trifolium medium]|nr:hypothetical protein [Trifolium medium]